MAPGHASWLRRLVRAAVSAVMLAMEPPERNTPPAVSGNPTCRRRRSMVASSIAAGPEPCSQLPENGL